MALGPVLRYELITTSRRGRYYVARVVYGWFLLFSLSQEYSRFVGFQPFEVWNSPSGSRTTPEETIRQMTMLAEAALMAFAWSQWVTVLVVVPALVSGVIADAHRRKTLRDLLSSGLSSRSIILGKLGARLVHVGVFALLGLPVVALVGMFGGLDPWAIVYAYGGMASMALALGGMSILASTLARRPREAIILAYALEVAWLFLPLLLHPIVRYLTWPFYLLEPLNDLMLWSNPIMVWSQWSGVRGMSVYGTMMPGGWFLARTDELHHAFLVMAGLQVACALLCIGLAVVLLRPLRSGDGEMPWVAFRTWLRRRLGRPPAPAAGWSRPSWMSVPTRVPCGDDPMWWKERHATARGGLAWTVSLPFVLFLGTLLGCYLYDVAWPSLLNVVSFGSYHVNMNERITLHESTQMTGTLLFAFWLLAVASAGAVAMISEREDDTWTSLTTTLLTGPEVVRAKVLGALWGTRRLALAVLSVIAVGVLGGGIHPLGALAAVLGMAAFGGFTAALGVCVSIWAKNSTRALVVTVLLLFLINVGPMYLGAAFDALPDSFAWMAATMPMMECFSLLSYQDARTLWDGGTFRTEYSTTVFGSSAVIVLLASLTIFGLSAMVLTAAAGELYDRVAGRARRNVETSARFFRRPQVLEES